MAKNVEKKKKRRVFNLLKPYKPPATGWDRIYEWLIGKARVVMIITEIIVAVTFVLKVVVDMEAKNLEDRIKAEKRELNVFAQSIEPEIRVEQAKAKNYKQIWNASSFKTQVLQELNTYITNSAADVKVSMSGNEVTLSVTENFDFLSQVESSIKASSTFIDVTSGVTVNPDSANASYQVAAKISEDIQRKQL